jgi:hypothetical protein
MYSIQHPYISVEAYGGKSYGGGQQFSGDAMVRRCGCGIVAGTDLLLYLSRWHMPQPADFFLELNEEGPLPFAAYNNCILRMRRKYFPVIPYAGINGLMLMTGMLRFFHDYRMPYTARWCFLKLPMWDRIAAMLREDIPVIMSVGPNFPLIWGNRRVRFYRKTGDGFYLPSSGAKAHYFTVTGMDEEWLRISSWGRLYYLSRLEFEQYVSRYSIGFASNILLVERK